MNAKIESMRRKINGCKELLAVFQDERKAYQAEQRIGLNGVIAFLEKKKELISMIEAARSPELSADADDQADKEQLRSLRGELSRLLEQLLVIDNENEKLLRRVLSGTGSVATAPQSAVRPRPALQQRLPFCPDMRRAPLGVEPRVPAAAPAVIPSAVSPAARAIATIAATAPARQPLPRMPRTQLRQYIDADAFARQPGAVVAAR